MTWDVVSGTEDNVRRLGELVAVARQLAGQPDLEQALELVAEGGLRAFCCDAVGLLLVQDGMLTVAAPTEPDAELADLLQLEHGEGPGLEAASRKGAVLVGDLRDEARWQSWRPLAERLRWRSVLSVSLVSQDRPFGALNLYSRRPEAFVRELALAELFSAQASMALAGAKERDTLLKAVEARHLIGQAQGILMERYSVDAEQAFTVLRRYSSHLNRKLRQVAEDIVQDRQLPTL